MLLKRLWLEEEGANMIEYGLLAALIGIALIVVLGNLKTGIENTFDSVIDDLD